MKRRMLAVLLAAAMVLSLAACGGKSDSGTDSSKTESKESEKTEETVDIANMSDDEIKEALKKEPAWGTTLYAEYDGGDCTAGPALANYLGYFEDYGLKVEILAGTEITEAIGTNKAQFGVHHIAHMLVPVTNGVDIIFTGPAQTGCQSLYVRTDAGIETTKDLVGKKIGVNIIAGSSHNMGLRFLMRDGINISDVEFVQVEQSAAIASMESGEIAGYVCSDRFAKSFVDEGSLKSLRSITFDDDFKEEVCCVCAMNGTFAKENPVTAQVLTKCTMAAYKYVDEHQDEAAQIMLDQKFVSGSLELTNYMLDVQDFGVGYDTCESTLKSVAEDYIKAGVIDSSWTVDKVMDTVWKPMSTK